MFWSKKQAPRMTALRARHEESILRAKVRRLAEAQPARQGTARRQDRWAPIHHLVGLKVLRVKLGLALDRLGALARGKRQLASLEAKRKTLAASHEKVAAEATGANARSEAFASQFEDSPNLLTGVKRWTPVGVWILVVALLSLDFGLNLPGFELVIDSAAPLFGVPIPLDLIAATAFTVAQGVGVKLAGKHAAWGWSPLAVCADRRDARSEDDGEQRKRPEVPSEWSRCAHKIIAITAGSLVVASVIAVVAIRLPALALLNESAAGDASGGLIGGNTTAPEGGISGAALSAVSLLPLMIAALVSGWFEGPMRSSFRMLRKDCAKLTKAEAKLTKAINKIDAKRVRIGITLNAIAQGKGIEQRLAEVGGATETEVVADEAPALFGVFDPERPATVAGDGPLQQDVAGLAPPATQAVEVSYPESLSALGENGRSASNSNGQR